MLRRVFALLTILCLAIAPGLAATHAAAMTLDGAVMDQASEQDGAMTHHGGDGAGACHDRGDCPKNAALCAWACAGIIAVAPQPVASGAADLPRMTWAVPGDLFSAGLKPAPTDRPPNSTLL